MKRNYFMLACACLFLLAGCSSAPEIVPAAEDESAEISAAALTQAGITGPLTVRMGNAVTFTYPEQAGYTTQWTFGKYGTNGQFTDLSSYVITLPTPNTSTYKIVVLEKPGNYIIKADRIDSSGNVTQGSSMQITVPVETTPPGTPYPKEVWIELQQAYKTKEDNGMIYLPLEDKGWMLPHIYTKMNTRFDFKTFTGLVSSANPCSKYLIPVYMNPKLPYISYDIVRKQYGSVLPEISFYIFNTQLPGTVPLYLVEEVYVEPSPNPHVVHTNQYFSTENIQNVIGLQNKGRVGYAFPLN